MKIEVNIPEEWDDENGVQYVVSGIGETENNIATRLWGYLKSIGIEYMVPVGTVHPVEKIIAAARKRWVEYHAFFNVEREYWPEEYVHDEPYRDSILVYTWEAHQLEELGFKV